MSERSYYESMLPPSFRDGLAASAPSKAKCFKHGWVDLVDAEGLITNGPDGTCPFCRSEETDGLHWDCPEHGRIRRDGITGKCPVCAAAGDPEGLAASARYHAPQEALAAADIWPASIFSKPGERDGELGSPQGGLPQGGDLVAPERGATPVDQPVHDRAGVGGAGVVPRDPVQAHALDLDDNTLQARIATLRQAVADGIAEPEDCVMLGRYMKMARERGMA